MNNPIKTISQPGNKEALQLWREVVISDIENKSKDLSARQMAVLLILCTEKGPHTVRALAETLSVGKPVITRALNALSHQNLASRMVDPKDRRNIFITPTNDGVTYIANLSETIMKSLGNIG